MHEAARDGVGGASAALQIVGVTHRYGSLVAVDDLTLLLPRGITAGLIGPNGSGKSTTLGLCSTLLQIQSGRVMVQGWDVSSQPMEARRRFAYVPDIPTGFEQLSAREYLELYASLQGADEMFLTRAHVQMEALGMSRYLDRMLGALSTGTRRKVAVIAGCAALREVLLLDEATSALDPEAVAALEALLRFNASVGRSALIATQDLSFAERSCDLVFLLSNGALVAHGAPRDLCRDWGVDDLQQVFLAATGFSQNLARLNDALAATIPR